MIRINLIAESELLARQRARRFRRWTVVVIVAAVTAAFPVGVELSHQQKLLALQAERRDVAEKITSTTTALNAAILEVAQLKSHIARADALRSKRSWSRLLALISRAVPDDMWLISLATDPPAPRSGHRSRSAKKSAASKSAESTEPKVVIIEAPRALVLEGYTLQHHALYEFMSRLKGTKVFNDVELTTATEEPVFASKAIRFKLLCRW